MAPTLHLRLIRPRDAIVQRFYPCLRPKLEGEPAALLRGLRIRSSLGDLDRWELGWKIRGVFLRWFRYRDMCAALFKRTEPKASSGKFFENYLIRRRFFSGHSRAESAGKPQSVTV